MSEPSCVAPQNIAPSDVRDDWDAGDMGCGELILGLRLRMRRLRAGEVLHVIALDPGAREDLPAWCRMTGYVLAGAEHPHYWIRQREE